MSSRLVLPIYAPMVPMSATTSVPTVRGPSYVGYGGSIALQKLPTDYIGEFLLTLSNVVIGSSVQVSTDSGISVLNTTATSANVLLTLNAYAPGSEFNSLVIKIRKGSGSPYYQPYQTLTTAIVGSQSIYVSQIPEE